MQQVSFIRTAAGNYFNASCINRIETEFVSGLWEVRAYLDNESELLKQVESFDEAQRIAAAYATSAGIVVDVK